MKDNNNAPATCCWSAIGLLHRKCHRILYETLPSNSIRSKRGEWTLKISKIVGLWLEIDREVTVMDELMIEYSWTRSGYIAKFAQGKRYNL